MLFFFYSLYSQLDTRPQRIWVEFDDGEENEKDVTWFVCWGLSNGSFGRDVAAAGSLPRDLDEGWLLRP